MASKDQIKVITIHGIKNSLIGRVRYSNSKITLGGGPGHEVVIIAVEMSIVGTASLNLCAVDGDHRSRLIEILPTSTLKPVGQIFKGEFVTKNTRAMIFTQIVQRILKPRCVVIIGTKDEEAGQRQELIKGVKCNRDSLFVGEEVTSADHQIWLEVDKGFDISDFLAARRGQMKVREVQDSNRCCSRGEHRQGCLA